MRSLRCVRADGWQAMTQEATATLMMRAMLGRKRNSTMKTAAAKLMMRLRQQPKLLQKRPRLLKLKRRRRRRSGASARRAMPPPAAAATKNLKALQTLVMTWGMMNRHRSRRRPPEKGARPADLLAAFATLVLLCCSSLNTWHICAFVMNSFGFASRAQLRPVITLTRTVRQRTRGCCG